MVTGCEAHLVLFQNSAERQVVSLQRVRVASATSFSDDPPRYGLGLLRDPLYMFLYMFGFINSVKSGAHLPQIDELFPRSSPNR